ncbi:helix-turn-helix domain-containing GNAT family N-acetyltransferase [Nocardia sp. BMG111209]|uniref:bifunctional helix-turn-helix transcriptional regulator/GNAT family N-acetyltransferase n=1 Tax=Nocardia sp. BMG111209 TaxID=1160137 RepID=UPI00036D0A7A|nr:helix-turn-helix domain-containing GNAT family N-acetyltransferase [Nocardia sp. BMG111209]
MNTVTDHTVDATDIATVREFNRRYTRLIGVLHEHLVETDYSLTEARVLFELAHAGPTNPPARAATTGPADATTPSPIDTATLRHDLGLDPGYLSRILARFEELGLVTRRRSERDGRRQAVRLTDAGAAAFADLNERSSRDVAALLAGHSPADRARLVEAMRTVGSILDRRGGEPILREPRPGDHGWVIARNAALYAAEYGWDDSYETLVARIVAEYLGTRAPGRERAWIAEYDGAPVGAVYCVREDDTTARLRLLLVEPSARGLGVGSALIGACLRFAADAGYRSVVLWTNDVLTAARRIYQRAGFELVESAPHHSFGKDLVGQTWRLDLERTNFRPVTAG